VVAGVVPLSSEGLAAAFKALHSRHTQGKFVVDCSLSGQQLPVDLAACAEDRSEAPLESSKK
jgi:hypothetical protein